MRLSFGLGWWFVPFMLGGAVAGQLARLPALRPLALAPHHGPDGVRRLRPAAGRGRRVAPRVWAVTRLPGRGRPAKSERFRAHGERSFEHGAGLPPPRRIARVHGGQRLAGVHRPLRLLVPAAPPRRHRSPSSTVRRPAPAIWAARPTASASMAVRTPPASPGLRPGEPAEFPRAPARRPGRSTSARSARRRGRRQAPPAPARGPRLRRRRGPRAAAVRRPAPASPRARPGDPRRTGPATPPPPRARLPTARPSGASIAVKRQVVGARRPRRSAAEPADLPRLVEIGRNAPRPTLRSRTMAAVPVATFLAMMLAAMRPSYSTVP